MHPYSNNVLKRTIKTPKVYFYDTGPVCYLTRWSSPEVAKSGAILCMADHFSAFDRDNLIVPIRMI